MPLLHHTTTQEALEDIRTNGLKAGAYFVHEDWEDVADYYLTNRKAPAFRPGMQG